jgi:alpha-glucosidase (family GH31 glycosyl hydrolase)
MPLYVRGGAILPLGPVKQYVYESVDEPMTIQIYPGADGAFTLYEDDGASFDHQRGEWMGIEMRWTDRERQLDLRLAAGSKMRPPNPRRLRVRVAGSRDMKEVTFSGAPLQVRL